MAKSRVRSIAVIAVAALLIVSIGGLLLSQSRLPKISFLESCGDCDVQLRSLGLTEVAVVSVSSRQFEGALFALREQLQDAGYNGCVDAPLENGAVRLLRFSRSEEPEQFLTAIVYPVCEEGGCDSKTSVEFHLSSVNLKMVGLLFPKIPSDMCG